MNAQIKALIRWAKKYADADSKLETTIEGKPVVILIDSAFDGDLTLRAFSDKNTLSIEHYSMDLQKWMRVKR